MTYWIISILAVIVIAKAVFIWQLWTEVNKNIRKNNQLYNERTELKKVINETNDEIDDLRDKNINLKTKYENLKYAVKSLKANIEKIKTENRENEWVETKDDRENSVISIKIKPSDNDLVAYNIE